MKYAPPAALLALLGFALWRCTVQVEVPRPEITIECAVVDLGVSSVQYCDAGDGAGQPTRVPDGG